MSDPTESWRVAYDASYWNLHSLIDAFRVGYNAGRESMQAELKYFGELAELDHKQLKARIAQLKQRDEELQRVHREYQSEIEDLRSELAKNMRF